VFVGVLKGQCDLLVFYSVNPCFCPTCLEDPISINLWVIDYFLYLVANSQNEIIVGAPINIQASRAFLELVERSDFSTHLNRSSFSVAYSAENDRSLRLKVITYSARATLVGIELMAMINKGQMKKTMSGSLSAAEQFYALAA